MGQPLKDRRQSFWKKTAASAWLNASIGRRVIQMTMAQRVVQAPRAKAKAGVKGRGAKVEVELVT